MISGGMIRGWRNCYYSGTAVGKGTKNVVQWMKKLLKMAPNKRKTF
jgi:hypothetical protein